MESTYNLTAMAMGHTSYFVFLELWEVQSFSNCKLTTLITLEVVTHFLYYDPCGYGRAQPTSRVYLSRLFCEIDAKDAAGLMRALGFTSWVV